MTREGIEKLVAALESLTVAALESIAEALDLLGAEIVKQNKRIDDLEGQIRELNPGLAPPVKHHRPIGNWATHGTSG